MLDPLPREASRTSTVVNPLLCTDVDGVPFRRRSRLESQVFPENAPPFRAPHPLGVLCCTPWDTPQQDQPFRCRESLSPRMAKSRSTRNWLDSAHQLPGPRALNPRDKGMGTQEPRGPVTRPMGMNSGGLGAGAAAVNLASRGGVVR